MLRKCVMNAAMTSRLTPPVRNAAASTIVRAIVRPQPARTMISLNATTLVDGLRFSSSGATTGDSQPSSTAKPLTIDDLGVPPSQRARTIAEIEAARTLVETAKQKAGGDAEHPSVLEALNQLAHVFNRAGDIVQEVETLDMLVKSAEKVFGAKHPNTLMVQARRLAALRNERPEEAKNGLLALQPDFVQVFGSDHEVTLTLGHSLAAAYHVLEDYEAEKALLTQQLEVLRRTMGECQPPTGATVLCLSRVLGYLDDPKANLELLQKHYDIASKEMGLDHPHVMQVACGLALAKAVEDDFAGELELRKAVAPAMEKRFGAGDVNVLMNTAHTLIAEVYSRIPAGYVPPKRSDSDEPFPIPGGPKPAASAPPRSATPSSPAEVPAEVTAILNKLRDVIATIEQSVGLNHSDTLNLLLRFADALSSFPGLDDQGEALFKVVETRARQRQEEVSKQQQAVGKS